MNSSTLSNDKLPTHHRNKLSNRPSYDKGLLSKPQKPIKIKSTLDTFKSKGGLESPLKHPKLQERAVKDIKTYASTKYIPQGSNAHQNRLKWDSSGSSSGSEWKPMPEFSRGNSFAVSGHPRAVFHPLRKKHLVQDDFTPKWDIDDLEEEDTTKVIQNKCSTRISPGGKIKRIILREDSSVSDFLEEGEDLNFNYSLKQKATDQEKAESTNTEMNPCVQEELSSDKKEPVQVCQQAEEGLTAPPDSYFDEERPDDEYFENAIEKLMNLEQKNISYDQFKKQFIPTHERLRLESLPDSGKVRKLSPKNSKLSHPKTNFKSKFNFSLYLTCKNTSEISNGAHQHASKQI